MVSLNFTLVIELLLFVLFLFGTTRFILRPALKVIDERDERVDADESAAEKHNATATALEAKYQKALARARAEAEDAYRAGHMRLIDEQAARLTAAQRAVDDAVLATRAQGEADLEARRAELKQAAPAIAREMGARLGMKGTGA